MTSPHSVAAESQLANEQGLSNPQSSGSIDRLKGGFRFLNVARQVIGPLNTAHAIHDRIRLGEFEEAGFDVDMGDVLARPLHLTGRPSDIYSAHEVLRQGVYKWVETCRDEVADLPVVDMGANIGVAAAYFATLFPRSRVLAFEPHPRNYEHLVANASKYPNIEPVFAAVSPSNGVVRMEVMAEVEQDYSSNKFFTASPETTNDNTVAIPSITPDQIIEKIDQADCGTQIGLIKIDVEGSEKWLCRSGSMDEILRRTRVLAAESHDQWHPGSSEAIREAALDSGLTYAGANSHTEFYLRP